MQLFIKNENENYPEMQLIISNSSKISYKKKSLKTETSITGLYKYNVLLETIRLPREREPVSRSKYNDVMF